jgi:UDP-glucose 4-epimerase
MQFVGIDNFSTTEKSIGISPTEDQIIPCDILETDLLKEIIDKYKVELVVHLAGLKSVRVSQFDQDNYFLNNVQGTKSILKAMTMSRISNIVFASTAGVYRYAEGKKSYCEEDEIFPASFYGQTKIECEKLLSSFAQQINKSSAVALRFFNVGGAIEKQLKEERGENVFPELLSAIQEKRAFKIFGLDYPTPDGSAIRDYIHVKDLVDAIILCLKSQLNHSLPNFKVINLGTSSGTSVLELVEAFAKTFQVKIDVDIAPRRDGDIPYLLADSNFAEKCLGWKATNSLRDIANSYLD